MRRKSFWLSVALVISISGSVLATLALLTQHVPAFYLRSAVPEGRNRHDISGNCVSKVAELVYAFRNSDTDNLFRQFTDTDFNCYFAEDFLTSSGFAGKLAPYGIHDIRIAFEQDRVRLGFRYGKPPWSTIVSVDFRVWLAKGEPNVVVLELQGMHAGALPISAQSLLEDISDALRKQNIQVTWYRHQGNPTAALKFQTDQMRATSQLKRLDLNPGILTIQGYSSTQ